ncbi:TetR family transcriptional regulator [Frankia sp. CNm7]|uniref:TetR family transcriptional regulator n=1 Tax=Frankia nepalensis TaxID=1836974 RepID=A0A937RBR9_9ACTN|nr:TetR family transcriptional regulator [Frankia nepalensis]MBL7495428.1 TetR family transcriptional regulator [Frankia nepalensis]MBL7510742.1 TetR family transcriptional regulator [Frankia nepalensis]MBL7522667.1 TetR family transcriptional regulator [Frankia nepalensis]MBL7625984.1 TetR family transcriptional regulator [Frankia nepalensis]
MDEFKVRTSRPYDSPLRREQARVTERRILAAAERLLLERGYAGVSIAAIAAEAEVSAQTIYKTFGTKAALTKRLYDVTLVGDDEPVPLAERPEFRALVAEADPRRALVIYARIGRLINERLGHLYAVILAGAQAGDEDLRALVAVTEQERLTGTCRLAAVLARAGALRPGLTVGRAGDLLWALTAPELFRRLTADRGWTPDEFEDWLARAMADAVLAARQSADQAPA